jgi:hypothetical protein
MSSHRLVQVLYSCAVRLGGSGAASGTDSGFCISEPHIACRVITQPPQSPDLASSDFLPVLCSENEPASMRPNSQAWRTSIGMQCLNSGKFQKKFSAGASKNGRIDGTSVCVRACSRVLLCRWLVKRWPCVLPLYCNATIAELFDCPWYDALNVSAMFWCTR